PAHARDRHLAGREHFEGLHFVEHVVSKRLAIDVAPLKGARHELVEVRRLQQSTDEDNDGREKRTHGDLRGQDGWRNSQTELSCRLFHIRVHRLHCGPASGVVEGARMTSLTRFAGALLVIASLAAPASAQMGYFGQNKVQYQTFTFKVLKT